MKKLLLIIFPVFLWAQNPSELRINHFSVNNGLSQYDVSSILQDQLGFIWVGTYDGLNRFDGFQSRIFRHQSNVNSIEKNRVVSLETDKDGNIWIGCDNGGLSIFNIRKASFYNLKLKIKNPFHENTVSLIKRLPDGRMMIMLQGGKFYELNVTEDDVQKNFISLEITRIQIKGLKSENIISPKVLFEVNHHLLLGSQEQGLIELVKTSRKNVYNSKQIIDRYINSAFVDRENLIWLATNNGLVVLKFFDNFGSCINLSDRLPNELTSGLSTTSICEDSQNQKWIGTASNGLYLLRKNNSNVEEYSCVHYLKSNSNLHSNRITKLLIDKSNILWIGSNNDGLGFSDLSRKIFNNLNLNIPGDSQSNAFVSSVFADSYNNIWVGSEDYGLFRFDKKKNSLSNYTGEHFGKSGQVVNTSFVEDRWGTLWFGTWNGCFYVSHKDILRGDFNFCRLKSELLANRLNSAIYAMAEDSEGELWLGSKSGLFRVKRQKEDGAVSKVLNYIENANGLSANVFAVCSLPNRQIFIGTKGNGAKLITYNLQDDKIHTESFDINQKLDGKRLISNNIWCITNAGGYVWMGTDEGVVILKKKRNTYEVLTNKLLNEAINYCKVVSIAEDLQGYVWLATNDGAVKVNPKNNHIQFFRNKEGLKSNTVSAIAVRRTDGVLYFGGIKGVNFCDPSELNPPLPNVVPKIIQIKINGNDMLGLALKGEIDNVDDAPFLKQLDLNYNQNNIALTISTFEFLNPAGSDFQYKMEGRDENWITSRNGERIIIYQNLPPGSYKFLLKSSKDLDQSKIQPFSIIFKIGVPPWFQWWAVLIYLVISGVAVFFGFRMVKSRIRLDNELKMEKYRRSQDKELNDLKTKLFVNISHELRTPLSLILSPVKEISKFQLEDKVKSLFNIVQYNSNRLLMLTNQILDAQRKDHLILNIEERDVVALLKLYVYNFRPLALEKNIIISENYSSPKIVGFFDKEILEKIISNLILNAIKYTPENGHIHLQCNASFDKLQLLEISIQDDGKGISEQKMEDIFKPFFQEVGGDGFGIGLSAVKQMVDSHLGQINVHSKMNMGSKFVVSIPISKEAYLGLVLEGDSEENVFDDTERKLSNSEVSKRTDTISVLIVEDNFDLRKYLTNCLISDFVVYTAQNGEEGFQKAKIQNPDIIVSDIMMPVMDGIELAKLVFLNESTKHIPIIFLSAKGTLQNQFDGIQTGAVDYIVKPVDVDILKSKIHNQIRVIRANRERIRNLYLHSAETVIENTDESEFISKAQSIITANMSNNQFDVSLLASEMACSKMQLHRRFKTIMDTSPGEFIRLTKLKVAYNYLTSGSYNVSEIVMMCGFENHSHFTKMIKQHFGKTPKNIILETKNDSKNEQDIV
ncbi:MAG: two-component regulator propeller domain-containing protein [Bacteroidales bacterium]